MARMNHGCGALRAARISSRPLAVATTDNALLAPEPAAGRHKRSRTPADITTTKGTPARRGGAHRWTLLGGIHAGGDGSRTAREYAGTVGIVAATLPARRPSARRRCR